MMFLHWLFGKKYGELKIVAAFILTLIALPAIAVVVVASSGVAAVSAAVAVLSPQTHEVTIFDPNGKVKDIVKLETSWPTQGYVSSEFGATETIRSELGLGPHTGIDIAYQTGIPIYSFMDGTVLRVDTLGLGTCGKYVQVDHHVGGITSLYCHMSNVEVKAGDPAPRGTLLGEQGMTGAATGPHLHFQVIVNGVPVNPRTFVDGEPDLGDSHAPTSIIPKL